MVVFYPPDSADQIWRVYRLKFLPSGNQFSISAGIFIKNCYPLKKHSGIWRVYVFMIPPAAADSKAARSIYASLESRYKY